MIGTPIVSLDDSVPDLTIFWDGCIELAGIVAPYSQDYQVTVTGVNGDLDFELDCQIDIEVGNPCAGSSTTITSTA